MIWKGFKFGMVLQLAVGPMCLLVFSTSTGRGFLPALSLVFAIAIIDALYITLSGIGVSAFIGRDKVKKVIRIFGGIILIIFGVQTIISIFDLSLLPNIGVSNGISNQSPFIQGLILTASNPLTILFWSGVFSTQVAENGLTKNKLFRFGTGCVLSTLVFLTFVAVMGSVVGIFLPVVAVKVLNCLVGILLVFFGVKMFTPPPGTI